MLTCTLLERAENVGGMAASFVEAGYRDDQGSHRLDIHAPGPLLRDLQGMLGEDLQLRRRASRIRIGDRWLAHPLRADDVARQLNPAMLARIARDSSTSALRRSKDSTYADV